MTWVGLVLGWSRLGPGRLCLCQAIVAELCFLLASTQKLIPGESLGSLQPHSHACLGACQRAAGWRGAASRRARVSPCPASDSGPCLGQKRLPAWVLCPGAQQDGRGGGAFWRSARQDVISAGGGWRGPVAAGLHSPIRPQKEGASVRGVPPACPKSHILRTPTPISHRGTSDRPGTHGGHRRPRSQWPGTVAPCEEPVCLETPQPPMGPGGLGEARV